MYVENEKWVQDDRRGPKWTMMAYAYMNRRYPEKYRLKHDMFLEGFANHYRLVDRRTEDFVGPEIIITPNDIGFGKLGIGE